VDVEEHSSQGNVRLCLTTHFIMFGLQVNVNTHRLAVSHKLLTRARMSSLWFEKVEKRQHSRPRIHMISAQIVRCFLRCGPHILFRASNVCVRPMILS
jgi:hypothetical protein